MQTHITYTSHTHKHTSLCVARADDGVRIKRLVGVVRLEPYVHRVGTAASQQSTYKIIHNQILITEGEKKRANTLTGRQGREEGEEKRDRGREITKYSFNKLRGTKLYIYTFNYASKHEVCTQYSKIPWRIIIYTHYGTLNGNGD